MCPYCNAELEKIDEFGLFNQILQGDFIKKGDILQCPNADDVEEDKLCESSKFNGYFYIRNNESELNEGYPC